MARCMLLNGITADVVSTLSTCMNFHTPNTEKAVLYYFKGFLVSKYRILMSCYVKFSYSCRDLEDLSFFSQKECFIWVAWCSGCTSTRVAEKFVVSEDAVVGNRQWGIYPEQLIKTNLCLWLKATGDRKQKLKAKVLGLLFLVFFFFPLNVMGHWDTSRVACEVHSLLELELSQFLRLDAFLSVNIYKSSKWWAACSCPSIAAIQFKQQHPVLYFSVVWPSLLCGTMIQNCGSYSSTLFFMKIWKIMQCLKNSPNYLLAGGLIQPPVT